MNTHYQEIMNKHILDNVVHHLLVEQKVNMQDRTKCSTSARNIYNYLCGQGKMQYNNNLSNEKPNLKSLTEELRCLAERKVYYVHFDHLTNETSHYFIIYQLADEVMVLQSAVFEFSIYEWLYPREGIALIEKERDDVRKVLGNSSDLRDQYELQQHERNIEKQITIFKNVKECMFSSGRCIPLDVFINEYVKRLESLEGLWTLENYERNCKTYTELFGCQLNCDLIKSHINLGIKPAIVKYCSHAATEIY